MFASNTADKLCMKIVFLSLLWVFTGFFFISCSFDSLLGNSLTQLSRAVTSKSFTESQKTDLLELARELHIYTKNDESCSQVRKALDRNETILKLEETHKLKPFFIYDEFLTISIKDVIIPTESKERVAASHILAAWKEEATVEQIEAIILKIRKCYPDT